LNILYAGNSTGAAENGDAELPLQYTQDGRLPKPTKLSLVVKDAVRRWYLEAEKEADRGDVVSTATFLKSKYYLSKFSLAPPPPFAVKKKKKKSPGRHHFYHYQFLFSHCRKLKLCLDKCSQKAMDAKLIQLEAVNLVKKLAGGDTVCKACIVKYKLMKKKVRALAMVDNQHTVIIKNTS
jgi:hypothetical protein